VFLSAVTELTATLVLVPTGVQTLSTQFWAYQTNTAYGAAARYAAVILAIAAMPSAVLGAWFSRRPGGDVVVLGS
jgi:iron(III) transport system permease protein